jgi:hypothetical protein
VSSVYWPLIVIGWGLAAALFGLLLMSRAHFRFIRRYPPGSGYWESHAPGSGASFDQFVREEPIWRMGFFCMVLAPILMVAGLTWLVWVVVT